MSYKVTINNKSYELPKCTLAIEEMVEQMRETEKGVRKGIERKRTLVEQMIAFAEKCLGENEAKEAANYTDIEDVDTKEIEIVCAKIMNAYSEKTTKIGISDIKKLMADINNAASGENVKTLLEMSAKV